ncbi:MAG: AraC family transcriptional activator of pobA, partial [Salibacteraceae bacterium]
MKSKITVKNKIQSQLSFKISRFRKNIRKTNPHKHHSYFEIIYLSAGSGSHTIDNLTYTILPGTLFIVRQEQVHFWDITSEPEGYVILVKRPLVEQSHDPDLKQVFSVLSTNTHTVSTQTEYLESLFNLLLTEHESKTPHPLITEGLLKALLYKILESNFTLNTSSFPAKNSPYQKLVDTIPIHITETHLVKFYAKILHTTPQNLNAICQKETGKSASMVISNYLITEAKRNLT